MHISRREWLKGNGAVPASGSPLPVRAQQSKPLVIDCHGRYTTKPKPFLAFRAAQIAALRDPTKKPASLKIDDDELRESGQPQIDFQRERGTDVTLSSPRAAGLGHHIGPAETTAEWSRLSNEIIHRICTLCRDDFIGVGQLPQSPGVRPDNCIEELERCVKSYGFAAINLNPDRTGGFWRDPPLTDRGHYPLDELDVPAMVHVSASTNPNSQGTGGHYLAADTSAFMRFVIADLFKDFPTLRMSPWRRRGAVSLGPVSRPRAGYEAAAARGAAAQRVVRHLRVPSGRDRVAVQGHSSRRRPVRLGAARRGARRRSVHRPLFRRHQALRRCACAQRRQPPQGVGDQRRRVYRLDRSDYFKRLADR